MPYRPYLANSDEVPSGTAARAYVPPPHRPERRGPFVSISTPEIRSPTYPFVYLNTNHRSWTERPRIKLYVTNP
jgi:hypothetical protein